MNPFSYVSKCYCVNCQKDNVVDIIDIYRNKLNYPRLIKDNNTDAIQNAMNSVEFLYMRCNNCGKTYKIDYSKGLPEPIYSPYLNDLFMTM